MAQAGFKRDILKLLRDTAATAKTVILGYADHDGAIPQTSQRAMKIAVGKVISDAFTPADNRSALAENGAARSPYANILNRWLAFGTYQAVLQQQKWLKSNIPHDVYNGLKAARGKNKLIREAFVSPVWQPPHTWRDEKGYVLSDRIWRADIETQRKIDAILTRGLLDGRGALQLAGDLESALIPGRSTPRTRAPYGTDASYNAMRLARTEIAAAYNRAAVVSAQSNPFVEGVDIARSPNGDPSCPICPDHATIDIDGSRIADPYPVDAVDDAPFHPHCMCAAIPVVNPDTDSVVDQIRADLDSDAGSDGSEYPENPADAWGFTESLLGSVLMGYLLEWLGQQV
jgi:hypothetical protein